MYLRAMGVAAEQLSLVDLTSAVVVAREERPARPPIPAVERATDRAALVALESSVADARDSGDGRPSLVLLAACLADLGAAPPAPAADLPELHRARDDWLRRLRSSCRERERARRLPRSDRRPARVGGAHGKRCLRRDGDRRLPRPLPRACAASTGDLLPPLLPPAPLHALGQPPLTACRDPFLDLEPPPKPRQERDWLTTDEFRLLIEAAEHPERNLPGLVERDRLTLLTLVIDRPPPIRAVRPRLARSRAGRAEAVTPRPERQGRQAAAAASARRPRARTPGAARRA